MNVLNGAISISKSKGHNYTLSFVGFLDPDQTKVFTYTKTHLKQKEEIP